MKIPTISDAINLIKVLGVRVALAVGFAAGCLVLVYLSATGVDVTIGDRLQELLIVSAAIVVVAAILGRTLTDVFGKRSSGEQPPPEDRRGE
jgi:hypothetical protein